MSHTSPSYSTYLSQTLDNQVSLNFDNPILAISISCIGSMVTAVAMSTLKLANHRHDQKKARKQSKLKESLVSQQQSAHHMNGKYSVTTGGQATTQQHMQASDSQPMFNQSPASQFSLRQFICDSIIFDPLWLLGVALAALSIYVNGFALEYGNAVLITSTVGFTIVCNDMLAWAVFGERFDIQTDGLSAFIVTLGSLICAYQQPKRSTYPSNAEKLLAFEMGTVFNYKIILFLIVLTVSNVALELFKARTFEMMRAWWSEFVSYIRHESNQEHTTSESDIESRSNIRRAHCDSFMNDHYPDMLECNQMFRIYQNLNLKSSFEAQSQPLLMDNEQQLNEMPSFQINVQHNLSSVIEDPEVLQMVLNYLKNDLSEIEDGPNEREIYDVLFCANLIDFMRVYMIKRRIVEKIYDDVYMDEQSIDFNEITMDVSLLIQQQNDLKNKLNWLLAIETFISGLYSGLSTVILKIIVGLLNIKHVFDHEGQGDAEQQNQLKTLMIVTLIALLYSVLANLFTLNNVLGMYPSLKAVPCYQSFSLITGVLAGGICMNEFVGYSCAQLLLISLGTMVSIGGLCNKLQVQ